MIHKTCLRCGRKLSAQKSQKIGYGPTCAVKAKYEESINYSSMEALMDTSNSWDSYHVLYRKSGLINASKVITNTQLKPTLKIDQQVDGSTGTFFHSDRSIAVATKYRTQQDKIGTYIHELIHARRYETVEFDDYTEIEGKYYNIPEEIIAELGMYIFFMKVGAFKNPESATSYLSHKLNRIQEFYLNRTTEFNRVYYTSKFLTYYGLAERVINYFMESL